MRGTAAPSSWRAAECPGCHQPFIAKRHNQLRCSPKCGLRHGSDTRSSQEHHGSRTLRRMGPRRFVSVDGEGVTDPETGEHRYVLLSYGEHHLERDGAHLEFLEIMEFLWSCFEEDTSAIVVGFYLSYDFGQWIRTLPEERARMLLDKANIEKRKPKKYKHKAPFPVDYEGWDFDYLPGKRFKIRKQGKTAVSYYEKDRYTGEQKLKTPWLYICDAGSYFQSTFLKAIDPKGNPNPVVTPEEYTIIEEGKARRESADFDPAMIKYNKLECDVLSRLMAQLEEGMREENLRPERDKWHGPGQLAQLWMRKIKVPEGETLRAIIPEEVRTAARCSYYGGWFETFWHGPVEGESYSYDINSAYPFVMASLPCLLHGEWIHQQEGSKGKLLTWAEKAELLQGFVLVRAHVEGTHSVVGAMRHRQPNRSILRPRSTLGWFWGSELAASLQAAFVSKVRLYEAWTYKRQCDCPPPLAPIADLYQGRLAVGKASPAGKARKLVYNSCAGKFQQSIGEPVFGNPVYASAITSGCRTLIAQAIACHPQGAQELLMVATDGVSFRTPHTALELDDRRLGAWTEQRHQNLSLFMSGVYWDDAARKRIAEGEQPVFKSRGVSARDLASNIEALDRAWKQFDETGWPAMKFPVRFQLVSPKQALARRKWELCGAVITHANEATWPLVQGVPREPLRAIDSNPRRTRIASGPGRSNPYQQGKELESLPYDGTFGDELREYQENEFGDNPDGPVGLLLPEMLLDH